MFMYMLTIGTSMKQIGNEYNIDKLHPKLDHFLSHERRIAANTPLFSAHYKKSYSRGSTK